MNVLVALPIEHPKLRSINSVIDGTEACSGTTGSFIRLANLLAGSGLQVCLSAASETQSSRFPCIKHELVRFDQFNYLIAHQSHWNGFELTFGNQALPKTILWLQNQTSWAFVHTFLSEGGKRIICPSLYHANIYRSIPQWREKVTVVYNSYCPMFAPTQEQPQERLLFVGAVTPNKGFGELMRIWSYLVQKQVSLSLVIAGDISIHKGSSVQVGSIGVAEADFENNHIQPWLKTLSKYYQPQFLGALSPMQLRTEIAQSWAVIVNPSWKVIETFCVAAVDVQACDRTVFSVATGGLNETVYQGSFKSLTKERSVEAVGDRIIDGLSHRQTVEKNGQLAGEFARSKFSPQAICDDWIRVLSGREVKLPLPSGWKSSRDLLCDLMRWSGTGMLISQYLLRRG